MSDETKGGEMTQFEPLGPLEYAIITHLVCDDIVAAILCAKYAIENGERTQVIEAVANASITAQARDLIDVIDQILFDREG